MSILYKSVHLPADLLEALGDDAGTLWSDPMLEPVICDAIRAWLKRTPAVQAQTIAASDNGYQWKEVFLPEGTKLRASFGDEPYFAMIEGAQIKHGGRTLSPSCFANLRGSGNRNAWKAIWLRLPGSEAWLPADVCRSARKAAIARMIAGDAPGTRPKPGLESY